MSFLKKKRRLPHRIWFCFKIAASPATLLFLIYHLLRLSVAVRLPRFFERFLNDHRHNVYALRLGGQLCEVCLRPQDLPILFEIFQDGVYNLDIPKNIANNITILDLGAHVGLCSLFFRLYFFPNAHYLCVEPADENFKLLQLNTAHFSKTKIIQKAVDIVSETVFLKKEKWSYNYQVDEKNDNSGQRIETITIPTLIQMSNSSTIHLLKMDIEGKEKDILKNDSSWLEQTTHFVVELHDEYSLNHLKNDLKLEGRKVHCLSKDCYWVSVKTEQVF